MAVKGIHRWKSVVDILLEKKPIDVSKIHEADAEADRSNTPIQTVLVEKGFMTKDTLLDIIKEEWQVEVADLSAAGIDDDAAKILPESVARRSLALPFRKDEKTLSVAMALPLDMFVIEDIQTRTGMTVKPFLALPQDILSKLAEVHGGEDLLKYGMPDPRQSRSERDGEIKYGLPDIDASAPEVEKMVNAIILAARKQRASSVHLEPVEDPEGKNSRVAIRLRVDGVLQPAPFSLPWPYRFALMARLKIMTNSMDITERRMPQNGRIKVLVQGEPLDLYVSTAPTIHGEACVLRVRRPGTAPPEFKDLGLLPEAEKRLLTVLARAGRQSGGGLVLVTGPGWSGKTWALYAMLGRVNIPGLQVVKAEESVEFDLAGTLQTVLNRHVGLDAAGALRMAGRMDADVVMIPEIADSETARMACEAALARRMVFCGMHTMDAPSGVARLLDMGIPPYIVADSLAAVLAVRLKRRLCRECSTPEAPNPGDLAAFKDHGVVLGQGAKLHRAKGCPACAETGFKGLLGLQELLVMSDGLAGLVLQAAPVEDIRAQAAKDGLRTLAQDGLEKAAAGLTTVREIAGLSPD